MSRQQQWGSGVRPTPGQGAPPLHPVFSRAWVVGCGLLGSRLVAAARAVGVQVLSMDAAAPADVRGDAACPAVLAKARALLEPEVIFCCAATHGGDEAAYCAVYVGLPQALLAACPAARVVMCSSSSVHAPVLTPRAGILLEGESHVLAAGGVVARLVPLYGGSRCELLRGFVQRERELPGADSRWLNYVHADDAARALLLLAALPEAAGHAVDVCAESFTKGEVYAALSRLTGLPRVGLPRVPGRRGVSNIRVCAAVLAGWGWRPQWEFLAWAATHWQQMR